MRPRFACLLRSRIYRDWNQYGIGNVDLEASLLNS